MAIADPRDISGLVAWYSAEAETGYANNGTMTQWTDLSGNGRHATPYGANSPQWQSATGSSGGPAVHFVGVGNGGATPAGVPGCFVMPAGSLTGATAGEVFFVLRRDTTVGTGDVGQIHAFSNPDYSYYTFGDGKVYDAFGSTARKAGFTPTLSTDSWRRVNIWSAPSDWAFSIDGTTQASTSTNTVSWRSQPVIGQSTNSGTTIPSAGATVQPFKGWMGAVVVFNRKLTATERADVQAWLTAHPSGGTTLGGGSVTGTLGAISRPEVASFASTAGTLPLSSELTATQPREVASFASTSTVVAERTIALEAVSQGDVITFAGRAVTPVAPAPPSVAAEAERAKILAQAFGPVAMQGTQPVYSISEAHAPRARQQIVVDGVDVTYFRGVITPDVSYTLLEPLLYGPGTLDLPQVSACFERPGDGALSWLRPGVTVEVNRVIDDVVVGTDYKGVVVAFDTNGRSLSVELGGEASGRAALRNRQAVIFPRVNDLGHQIADAVRDLGLPHLPALGAVTGIETLTTGGVGHLEHIQNLVAKAWTRSGGHWTVMPDEATGIYRTFQKDETTIHATAFVDDARTVANLRRDISEEPNRVYATAVSPRGERIRGGVYPDLNQGPVPDFPGHMESGSTGDGVRLLIGKLHAVGYLRLVEVAGGYDFDVVEAVKDLQDDAGLPKTGEVDEATWNALYDLNVTDTSLVSAHIEPFAQRSVVRQKNRSASGTVLGFNDEYDPDVLKVDLNVDMGPGLNRSQVRRFSRAKLHDSNDANWVGDITFHTGALLRGNVAVGATVREADVMDARELRPGMNIRLPQFAAGKTVHVSACQVRSDGTVTATVDTRWRDAMEVWEVIARNKESRNDPARRRNRDARSSTIAKDSIGEWDEVGGETGHDIKLVAGWNVFEVVAAMAGQIERFRLELQTPAEFACAVFGRPVDRGFMDDVIGLPLTAAGEKNWRRSGPRGRLRDNWLLYSAGTPDEPCGYGEDLKTDGADLTGVHRDEAGFSYRSEYRTKLYVAVWVPSANTIPLGRIMWPQLEAGV